MRFDLISIFPEYFSVLDLSLVGKAQAEGLIEVEAHDLRHWATGRHRSVDAPPAGGGAGMVMRPDVWENAIDAVAKPGAVLALPTPAGAPLTQRTLEDLSHVPQVVVACGRYEGIDARLADHYRAGGWPVLEFSLGDYVLNGGEVAALALVEGVSRLVEGVIGNLESLAEESHSSAGLLEYPVYTQPSTWRGRRIPAVLRGGNHALIQRWRRDEALRRTAERRPDMIKVLATRAGALDKRDREVLTRSGLDAESAARRFTFAVAGEGDLEDVSELAGRTFALACPPSSTPEEIAEFVETSLTAQAFADLMAQGARITLVRDIAGPETRLAAYCLTEPRAPEDIQGFSAGACYLSKLYSDPDWHGTGVAGALLDYALEDAVAAWGATSVLLGTNRENQRAIRFYRHHGFRKCGQRTFNVGGRAHHDYVFVRDLTPENGL